MSSYIPLISRILLAVIFLFAGLGKIAAPGPTQEMIASAGLPAAGVLLVAAIVIEVGGGLLLLIGYKTRWAAAALVVFTFVATLAFHTNFADQTQMLMFMKNFAIIGGLLSVYAYGAGTISVDNRSARRVQGAQAGAQAL